MKNPLQSLMDALPGVAYTIDLDGRITCIGRRGWRLFAIESGALELADPQALIGRHLFEFITGEEVRSAYARVLERLHLGEPHVTLPCHCDGPAVVRDMRMTVSPLRQGRVVKGFLFQSIPVTERTRPPMRIYEFARTHYPDSTPILGMCSLCERVCPTDCSDKNAEWMEAERYYARGGSSQVRISHTVCPSCFGHWVQGWTGAPPPDF